MVASRTNNPTLSGGTRRSRRFNPHLDIDRQIAEIAGEAWQTKAGDRMWWSNIKDRFVEKNDVPWASGEQERLENLAPNRGATTAKSKRTRRKKRGTVNDASDCMVFVADNRMLYGVQPSCTDTPLYMWRTSSLCLQRISDSIEVAPTTSHSADMAKRSQCS